MSLYILGCALHFVNTYDYIILDPKKEPPEAMLSAFHSNKQVWCFYRDKSLSH